jgi:two-component system, sporulation sensor kinase E
LQADNTDQVKMQEEIKRLRYRIAEMERLDAEHSRIASHALKESEARLKNLTENTERLQREIGRRQQAEAELETERRRLFSVLDGLPAQVYLIAPDYSFHFSNRFFQERFGNPHDRRCFEVFHRRSQPCEDCSTFKPGGLIACEQGEWSYPDGYTYIVYDYPFIDVDGARMLLAFGFDITERKKIEADLTLSEERFSKAFRSSPLAMAISSMEEGQFIDVNDSFCLMATMDREKILGHSSWELGFWATPGDRHMIQQMITTKQTVREMEIPFNRPDGEVRLALYTAESLEIKGQTCILSILSDITERKKMEIEMMRLDRLGLVGEMAASIGHEIRNPMTTVRGFLQMLMGNPKYAGEKDYFDLMIEELDRANHIISEFLSLAKDKIVELAPVNLTNIVASIISLVQSNALMMGQSIAMVLHTVPELLLDEKEMRQLVINLVYNALEAQQAGKVVTVRTYTENGAVVLAVDDQGPGIDQELLAKMGTPFFTTKEQGTGLGLAVCYGIAARHQARIDIDTGPQGTTFLVQFPIDRLSAGVTIGPMPE